MRYDFPTGHVPSGGPPPYFPTDPTGSGQPGSFMGPPGPPGGGPPGPPGGGPPDGDPPYYNDPRGGDNRGNQGTPESRLPRVVTGQEPFMEAIRSALNLHSEFQNTGRSMPSDRVPAVFHGQQMSSFNQKVHKIDK